MRIVGRAGGMSLLRGGLVGALVGALTLIAGGVGLAGRPLIAGNQPSVFTFPEQEARFVRVVVFGASDGAQACIDELEVRGPAGDDNLALAKLGAKPSASSCLSGYAQHKIDHLNDGEYGNGRSWIAASSGEEWAQIELPEPTVVSAVVLSRDRQGVFADRIPTVFEVRLSADGQEWTTVLRVEGAAMRSAPGGGAPAPPMPVPPPVTRNANGGLEVGPAKPDAGVPTADALGYENLALSPEARAAASSVYADGALPIHQTAHLNDGLGGNSHSWVSKGEPSWAEIDLGREYWVYRVGLANDREGRYADRGASSFRILAATKPAENSDDPAWRVAYQAPAGSALLSHAEPAFEPVRARVVRIAIASAASEARLDEIEVYGSSDRIAPADVQAALDATRSPSPGMSAQELLQYAFIAEEHAWLKTYGRADLDPSLVPYNGRVQEYPRHVGDDYLPLPLIAAEPKLDGDLGDECWQWASRGVVRVAEPYHFDLGPLATQEVWAARTATDLLLAVRADRLLSSHVAILSSEDWQAWGALALTEKGLALNSYGADGQLTSSEPVEGIADAGLTTFEARIPLSRLAGIESDGLRVGLGMGGRHTAAAGRPVHFVFAPLSIAEVGTCTSGQFRVRLAVPPGGEACAVTTQAGRSASDLAIAPGETRELTLDVEPGPVGPQLDLSIASGESATYTLHLFRYDPLERTLSLMEPMLERLEACGLNVREEARGYRAMRQRQEDLAAGLVDLVAEREAFLSARCAKRDLFLRDPDLAPLQSILFVKRQPYQPSHIYTDYTDAPFRPGGAVCRIDIPMQDGRLSPDGAVVTRLFESRGGIARDPVATFDMDRIYFGYRPAADGFYHIMSMRADGSDLAQITDGPHHDFYPCVLPNGDIAFITTRCNSRVLCFRWGSSALFRMKPDGAGIHPLSYSSVSEWAPSVMTDGRIVWTRWEYLDKGADFTQTLWSIKPDGTSPELIFGNTIIQPNGYACGREVPGTSEISCTLVSHFGDINGPIALVDPSRGRFNQKAIGSLTPEVPWPGNWPATECFRDPVPIARDLFLCSHAPRDVFGLYVIDRYGNREVLHLDSSIGSMGPTVLRAVTPPPVLPDSVAPDAKPVGRFVMLDVYQGLEPAVRRGSVKWLRVAEEVRHDIQVLPNRDHADFMKWYASPVDIVSGPFGWPTYTAKASLGLVPVAEDGSAQFEAPAGRQLYFEALDKDFNELQRMRSLVQLQPGETRTCIGCHEARSSAPPVVAPEALPAPALPPAPREWEGKPFSYEAVVQPVLDNRCISCHSSQDAAGLDLTGALDMERVPASYRTLITRGLVHTVDCGWNSGGCERLEPMTFGTLRSPLFAVLNAEGGHHGVALSEDEMLRLKTWVDLNGPLWPDYTERRERPGPPVQVVAGGL